MDVIIYFLNLVLISLGCSIISNIFDNLKLGLALWMLIFPIYYTLDRISAGVNNDSNK